MKNFRRVIALLAAAVMLLCALTACSKKETNNDKTDTPSETGKVTVRFMVNGSAEELAIYEKAVNAFNAQSEKTEVKLIGVTGDDYTAQVMTQLSTKEAPDCFYAEEGSYGELNRSGNLADLSTYLNGADSVLKKSDIPENILEAYSFGDTITGVPVDCNPEVLYFNQTLLESLGIKSPLEYVAEGTWNYANFQKVCEELVAAGKIGFVWENWWGPVQTFLLSQGDSLYTDNGQANIDTDRVRAGMNYLNDNMTSGSFLYAGKLESGESADTLFKAGDTGFVYAGRWSVPGYEDVPFTYDVVQFPYYEEPSQAICAMPATPMVMNAATTNPDNVWEFISFYSGAEGQRLRMDGQGNAVPTVPGLEDIVLTGNPANSQAFLDAVDIAFLYPQQETLHPGLTDALTGEVEKMLVGDQDADTTVANMQAAAQEMLSAE